MSIAFNYAARSNVGKVRKNNQDSGYAGPNLLILADGMGGPAGGDMASVIAVDHLRQIDALDTTSWSFQEGQQILAQQVANAHQEMHFLSSQDPALAGFGTTCIGLLRCQNNTLAISHIGDSRAYLLRSSQLKQVTKDHSFVQYLYETGQINQEDMATHPNRSVLLRVLGDSVDHDTPDLMQEIGMPGDRWLLCSDGLCGYVPLEDIYQIVSDTNTPPDQVADQLVEAALAVGAPDNVTVVVCDLVETEQITDQLELPVEAQVVGAAYECAERLQQLREQVQEETELEPTQQNIAVQSPNPNYDSDQTREIITYSSDRGETFNDYAAVTKHFVDNSIDTNQTMQIDDSQDATQAVPIVNDQVNHLLPAAQADFPSEINKSKDFQDFETIGDNNITEKGFSSTLNTDTALSEDTKIPKNKQNPKNSYHLLRYGLIAITIILIAICAFFGWKMLNTSSPTNPPVDRGSSTNHKRINPNPDPKKDPADPKKDPADPKKDPADPKKDPADPKKDPADPKN